MPREHPDRASENRRNRRSFAIASMLLTLVAAVLGALHDEPFVPHSDQPAPILSNIEVSRLQTVLGNV